MNSSCRLAGLQTIYPFIDYLGIKLKEVLIADMLITPVPTFYRKDKLKGIFSQRQALDYRHSAGVIPLWPKDSCTIVL